MNKIDNIIKTEIEYLVETGKGILRKAISLHKEIAGEELAEVTMWVTRLGQLIRKLYGKESQQFVNYSAALETKNFYSVHSDWNSHISQLLGIADAIKHDYETGLLFNIRTLIQADIFADFLEMGEYLLNEGYKDASAVIIGAVLEDGLRKLCEKQGLATSNTSGKQFTIEPLNASLAKEGVYDKLIQKQITSWAHIRNKAAHGEYTEYNKEQVQMMLLFVQKFSSDYLK